MFRKAFRRTGMNNLVLSRTIEDGVSVTSPLIPWSSCGVTQSTVLGVATLSYLPFCVFNYLTPVTSMIVIMINFRIKHHVSAVLKTRPA